jgi:septal ring factor EnvC (AmiA/AmiB activator)
LPSIGLPKLGRNEIALALSRIESDYRDALPDNIKNSDDFRDLGFVNLPHRIWEVVGAWRAENPTNSDKAAEAYLMGKLPAVLEVSAKAEAARLAQEEAERAGAQLTKAWREFEELPNKFEKVKRFLANVNAALADLESPTHEKEIRELMREIMKIRIESSHLADGRAIRLAELLPPLLLERDTVPFKLSVNRELKTNYEAEVERLKLENARLAKLLGTQPHKLG